MGESGEKDGDQPAVRAKRSIIARGPLRQLGVRGDLHCHDARFLRFHGKTPGMSIVDGWIAYFSGSIAVTVI
jgi:hypothetical protein